MTERTPKEKLRQLEGRLKEGSYTESQLRRCLRRETDPKWQERIAARLDAETKRLDLIDTEIRDLKREFRYELLPVDRVKNYKPVMAKPAVKFLEIKAETVQTKAV